MAGCASCDTRTRLSVGPPRLPPYPPSVAAVQGDKVFFAKNSDRPPNEEQEVVVLPEQEWPEGSQLKVNGYIEIRHPN